MTAKLYIGSYDVAVGQEHSYIFYDPNTDSDNNPTTGTDMRIIRGGTGINHNQPFVTNILIELQANAEDSVDWFTYNGINSTPESRNFRTLLTGSAATDAFNQMWSFAQSMGDANDPASGLYDTDIQYALLGPNSNSVVNSVLNSAGFDFRLNTPRSDNNPGQFQNPEEYPGHLSILDGSGNNNFTAYDYSSLVDDTFRFYKRGGNDTIILKAGAELIVSNDARSTGLTAVIFENQKFTDITVATNINDIVINGTNNSSVLVNGAFYHDEAHLYSFRFTDLEYRLGNDTADGLYVTTSGTYRLEGRDGADIYGLTVASGLAQNVTIIETIADGDDDTLVINGAGGGITWGDVMVLEDSVAGIWSVTLAGHPAFGATIVNVDAANDTSPLERITISGLGTRDIVDLLANDNWQEITLNDGTWAFSTTTLTDTADDGELTGTAGNDDFSYSWDDWSNNAWSGYIYSSTPFVVHQYGFGGNDNLTSIASQIVIGTMVYDTVHVIRHGGDGDDTLDGGIEQYGDAGNDRLLNAPLMVGGANDNSVHDSVYGNRKAA